MTSRRSRFNRTANQAPAGVEPIGTVRRSQLISTFGIGAIADLEKGSFMPTGLEDWEAATRHPALTISEARLEAQLGVSHFRLPPVMEQIPPTRLVNPVVTAPAIRFPEWHECPRCHRIGREGEPFELDEDGSRLRCIGHGGRTYTTPVRFVVACSSGHIEDFPWIWWCHRSRKEGACDNPTLYLRSHGRSAALGDLFLKCETCGSSTSLGDAFHAGSLGNRQCNGYRPWLHDRVGDCRSAPRVIQRGASNVHFAVVASALSIPPVSDAVFQIIDYHWDMIGSLPGEALEPVLASLAERYGTDPGPLAAAIRVKRSFVTGDEDLTDSSARADEYAALSADRDDPVVAGVVPHFRNDVLEPSSSLRRWFDLIGAASRLREVRALAGFSRIEPFPVSTDRIEEAILEGKIAPLARKNQGWLPAAEIRGEGIFLRFDHQRVNEWIENAPALGHRVAILEERSAQIAAEKGYVRDYTITPRLLLVHSFAHALIRQIAIDCGYSSSAIRERLYVAEPRGSERAMNGVLIFTGSPDSEGSLGGLVRLADPDLLTRIVLRTIRNAQWCGSDPVCLETDPRHSGDRISGAACHCCLLVPETACEKFNRELDRAVLVGDPEGAFPGYFGHEGGTSWLS